MAKLTKGYKTGKAQQLRHCCREIRISCPNELGRIYDGFNTLTNQKEYWMLIKISRNYYDNIMQQILLPN